LPLHYDARGPGRVAFSRIDAAEVVSSMPAERLRILDGLRWNYTVIRLPADGGGLETEMFFELKGTPFCVAVDTVPDRNVLVHLFETRGLVIYEMSREERGWVETGRYRLAMDEDWEGVAEAAVVCDTVRWTPSRPAAPFG